MRAASFSPAPYTRPVGHRDVTTFARRQAGHGRTVYLVLRNRDLPEDAWRALLGPFISALAAGRAAEYPGIVPVAKLPDAMVFWIDPGGNGTSDPGRTPNRPTADTRQKRSMGQ
jgi:hypothetical protein